LLLALQVSVGLKKSIVHVTSEGNFHIIGCTEIVY